jgi:hypothetical protein
MSLRAEIHEAIDEVSPPAPALEGAVVARLEALGKGLGAATHGVPHWPAWTGRLRGAMGLVAAAAVVALVAGLLLGGRYLRDLNAPPRTVSQTELQSLESRPLHYPTVPAGAACPYTAPSLHESGMVIGPGPVYLSDREAWSRSSWGNWVALTFVYKPQTPGLVLIRAGDLKTDHDLVFAQYPLAPTGIAAVGHVVGTDQVLDRTVQVRSEAAFHDTAHTTPLNQHGQRAEYIVLIGLENGASPCMGFQIDGPNFTENFVASPSPLGL